MNNLQSLLPPKIFEAVERAEIGTTKQILLMSVWDIEKLTHLSHDDIYLLKNVVSNHISPSIITCDNIVETERIPSGCPGIDNILNGGFRRGVITELYGESGSGKTQIAIQAAANNWPDCTVYICTEDLFPVKRFDEIKKGMLKCKDVDSGSNVFVEHITEAPDLLSCVQVRLPKLLTQSNFTLIIIDSIAAPFRVETANYIQRAEDLRELAVSLISLAQTFNLAILCINQVSASLEGPVDLLPSLGLAWSNMVTTRLYLKKTMNTVRINSKDVDINSNIRELSVIFAPDLPNNSTQFVIKSEGVQDLLKSQAGSKIDGKNTL